MDCVEVTPGFIYLQRPNNIQQVQEQAWTRLIAFFDKHLEDS